MFVRNVLGGRWLQHKKQHKGNMLERLTQELSNLKRQPETLQILKHPDARLSEKSKVVLDIKNNKTLQMLMDDMALTMERNGGIGLAAIQVGVPLNVIVVRVMVGTEPTIVKMINPSFTQVGANISFDTEGCLSFPGLFFRVNRLKDITVSYQDENGDFQTKEFSDISARVIQHEIEHLNGKVFVDNLHEIQRNQALKKYKNKNK